MPDLVKALVLAILGLCLASPAVAGEAKRPNILWLLAEDVSPWMMAYGDDRVATPNLDRVSEQGVVMLRAFAAAPICSPSRSALMTGRYPTSDGVSNHRSSRDEQGRDWVYLPADHKTLPEIFRQYGYDTFNIGKDDYNFVYDRRALFSKGPDGVPGHIGALNGPDFDWTQLGRDKPFFGQIQLDGGKTRRKPADPFDPALVEMPSYYPDAPVARQFMASHYDAIRIFDEEVGEILDRLEKAGLAENTIVFAFADHGMMALRHKQFVYDGGTHVPVFIGGGSAFGEKLKRYGTRRDELINLIDLAAASLDVAGLPVPEYFESESFFARDYEPRQFVVSSRDRGDFTFDRIRSIRSRDFRYIRNYFPDVPYMQAQYRSRWPLTREWQKLADEGKLTATQALFMAPTRPPVELYDLRNDPDQVVNLADDPSYAPMRDMLAASLDQWIARTGDKGLIEESEDAIAALVDRWGNQCVDKRCQEYRESHAGEQATPKEQ